MSANDRRFTDDDDAYEAQLEQNRLVHDELAKQRARRDARALLDAERARESTLTTELLDATDLDKLPHPEPLIEGVIDRHTYVILRGRDSTYKTFVALDWACCLATGTPWHGRRTEQVNVLYVAAEGAYGLNKRIRAWETHNRVTIPAGALTVLPRGVNLHSGHELPPLLQVIRERSVGLVVADTLRRMSGRADGNGSDMGAVVDNLDAIRRATTHGSVLALAHTGKSDVDTRGFSGIEDDADTVWHAQRDDDSQAMTLALAKAKDAPDGTRITVRPLPAAESIVLVGHTPCERETAGGRNETAICQVLLNRGPHEPATSSQLWDESGLKRTVGFEALNALIKRGVVVGEGTGNRRRYRLSGVSS